LPIKVKEDEQIVDENAEEEGEEQENAKKIIKKFDPEYESRTVFVGYLI
jgi:hypothetical protein